MGNFGTLRKSRFFWIPRPLAWFRWRTWSRTGSSVIINQAINAVTTS